MSFQSATGLGHPPTDEALVRQTKSGSASADAVVFVIESDDPARNAIKQLLEFVGLHVEPFRSAVEFLDVALFRKSLVAWCLRCACR